MKIMFVCTGNTCRSAMAHAMLQSKLKDNKNDKDIEVYSCGLYATDGARASQESIAVLQKTYNIDLNRHRATNIANAHIHQMDVILCATEAHKEMLLETYPNLAEKVYTIKEYAGYPKDNWDINDPWGCSYATFKQCASEIDICSNMIIKKIERTGKEETNGLVERVE